MGRKRIETTLTAISLIPLEWGATISWEDSRPRRTAFSEPSTAFFSPPEDSVAQARCPLLLLPFYGRAPTENTQVQSRLSNCIYLLRQRAGSAMVRLTSTGDAFTSPQGKHYAATPHDRGLGPT